MCTIYRIAGNFRGRKLSRISQICAVFSANLLGPQHSSSAIKSSQLRTPHAQEAKFGGLQFQQSPGRCHVPDHLRPLNQYPPKDYSPFSKRSPPLSVSTMNADSDPYCGLSSVRDFEEIDVQVDSEVPPRYSELFPREPRRGERYQKVNLYY